MLVSAPVVADILVPVAGTDDATAAHQASIDAVIAPTAEAVAEVRRDADVLDLYIEAKATDEVRDSALADEFVDSLVVVRSRRLGECLSVPTRADVLS